MYQVEGLAEGGEGEEGGMRMAAGSGARRGRRSSGKSSLSEIGSWLRRSFSSRGFSFEDSGIARMST